MSEKFTIDLDNLREDERKKLLEIIETAAKRNVGTWKPSKGERYYSLDSAGASVCSRWDNDNCDLARFNLGNCFKTEDESDFYKERLKVIAELRRFAATHNPPNFDRNVRGSDKYYLYFDQSQNGVTFAYIAYGFNAECIFASADIAKNAIKEIGEERLKKYYFCIPENK